MAKKQELATEGVKLNYTPSEMALVERARAFGDERKLGTWIRKASLKVAREVLAEHDGGHDKKKARG